MRFRNRLCLAAAAALTIAGAVTATAAHANTSPILCNNNNPDYCMNRAGGGIQSGTPIIGYTEDFDNNEDIGTVSVGAWVCGLYHTVHNGENGCLGPFTNGSGLNQRYDGDNIIKFQRRGTGFCVVPNAPLTEAQLGGCTDNGTNYVSSSGAYQINVYASNTDYAQGFGANRPVFLNGATFRSEQLNFSFTGLANIDQWFIVS